MNTLDKGTAAFHLITMGIIVGTASYLGYAAIMLAESIVKLAD